MVEDLPGVVGVWGRHLSSVPCPLTISSVHGCQFAYLPEGIRIHDLSADQYYQPFAAYGQSKLALLYVFLIAGPKMKPGGAGEREDRVSLINMVTFDTTQAVHGRAQQAAEECKAGRTLACDD